MNRFFLFLTAVVIVLAFTGCDWLFGPVDTVPEDDTSAAIAELASNRSALEAANGALDPAGAEYDGFGDAFMQTFAVEHKSGLNPQTLSIPMPPVESRLTAKATVPVYSGDITFSDGATGSYDDYPEPGLTTDYDITEAFGIAANVYMVTVTTTYPAGNDVIDTYIEEYYVLDESPVGTWTIADPVVDDTGSTDQKYRVRMEMAFDDGSTRYETIVRMIFPDAPELNDGGADEDGFAAFDITDSLDYPELAYPVTDANAVFSSVVVYTHEWDIDHSFDFWTGAANQDIIGVRYYTEHLVDDGARLKGTIVSYEKAISTLVSQDGTLLDQLQDLFVGSEHDVLAESVFRKEVVFETADGAIVPVAVDMNSIMRSHVVDINTQFDEELQLFNEDELKLLNWDGETYFIPTGSAAEIAGAAPDNDLIYFDKEGAYVENPADPANELIETVELNFQGPSDLAVLFRAITAPDVIAITEAVTGGSANDVPDTIDADDGVYVYTGDIGTAVADDPIYDLTTDGTVEAWVYVTDHENWSGIVHKGDEPDFSDEAYSLEFVDRFGKVSFSISQQVPSYQSRKVKSAIRLNENAWYYVVGTWDANNVNIYVFGGGVLLDSQSIANSLVPPEAYQSDGALLIGSQLLDDSQSSHGYWGLDGKINGVKVTAGAKDVIELTAHYDTYEPLTVNW